MATGEHPPQTSPSPEMGRRLQLVDMIRYGLERYEPWYSGVPSEPRLKTPLTKERYAAFERWLEMVLSAKVPTPWPGSSKQLAEDVERLVLAYEALSALACEKDISRETLLTLFGKERATLQEAIDFLGRENVHGPEDVSYLLGFCPKDIPPIPYTVEDLHKSLEIKEKTGVKEMLVLFVGDQDGAPLTGEQLNMLVQTRYDELGLGLFLSRPGQNQTPWYQNEKFFYEYPSLQTEWKLVTKQCIPESETKPHHWEESDDGRKEDSQEHAIAAYAALVEIDREKFSRPLPFEMLYTIALHLTATQRHTGTGEYLLRNKYHWSDIYSRDRGLVYVGVPDSTGIKIGGHSHDYWNPSLGVCLAR